MSYAAGDRITATRLNNLQSAVYGAIGSGTVAASQTNADVTDATVTFDTQTDGAQYIAWCVWDYNASGAPAATSTARLVIDGASQSPLATFNASGATERNTVSQVYQGTIASAGSHTFKLIATTSTNTTVLGVNSSITVQIMEVV